MAYDEAIADRVRELLTSEANVSERRMFGGLAFLIAGNMALAASSRGGLMVRVEPGTADGLVAATPAQPMEMRGRPMRDWLHLDAAAVHTERRLAPWVRRGVDAARALPPK